LASECHIITEAPVLADKPTSATRRYQHTPAPCDVELTDDDRVHVTFDQPQNGVAPGQAVVFYEGDRVLGGGWIR